MSWIERIKNDLFITCGDGKTFRPDYLNPTKSKDYNIAQFNFPGISGTLVTRGTAQGTKHNLEFYFQGEFNIDRAKEFEISADDPRPWTISHPMYDELTVQPISINFDNSNQNITKITCTVIETITEDNPKITTDPVDRIANEHEDLMTTFERPFSDVEIDISAIQLLQANATEVYNLAYPKIKLTIDATEFSNRFQKAQAAFINATAEPLAAMNGMNQLVTYVAEFKVEAQLNVIGDFSINSVKNRITALQEQFDSIVEGLGLITDKVNKSIFANNLGVIISTMCLSSSTPEEGDYGSANDVLAVMEQILETYSDYIEALDSLQTDNGGAPDSYIPDFESLVALSNIVTFTVANLYNIALNSKQERSIICEEDTNLILLTHRFYGLTVDDSTILVMMRTNQIGLNGILKIRKGTRIVYYV